MGSSVQAAAKSYEGIRASLALQALDQLPGKSATG
ncbi:hypothetical protein SAMN05216552_104832 [Pseudoduganella namucuonensis]|uniref:Uncharacterized protein n=1 Tax=Pseudoduganella namucuonensis TaxID=1035707 RepID=A0A1I7M200_9BURK|nr:hypothetical protein SAMN05216552_104832 [Pseudoduganella namucuonensis]